MRPTVQAVGLAARAGGLARQLPSFSAIGQLQRFSTDPLPRRSANYESLSPISFVQRAAAVFPQRTAVVQLTEDGERIWTWAESYNRCKQLASALSRRGISKGDVVAVMLPNVPEMFESHNGVPMCGAILNSINTRVDAGTIAYILEHGGAKMILVDFEAVSVVQEALNIMKENGTCDLPTVIDVTGGKEQAADGIGECTYEALLREGDDAYEWQVNRTLLITWCECA